MFNHQKSVGCIFSCSLGLLVLCLSASWLRLALLSGHLFFGAGNSENCLNQFLGKREVGSAGSISILNTGLGLELPKFEVCFSNL
ncbi:hypothetical protein BOO22_18725 [Vibrio cidicii]|nr:hypothetical protein [Vibrio cidicii]MBG0761441.1 hypothetical protein [Vibrio cidicii]